MRWETDFELFEHVHECQTVFGFISGRSSEIPCQPSVLSGSTEGKEDLLV
jgi:hypothetical protein